MEKVKKSNHGTYVVNKEFDKLMAEIFAAELKRANLTSKNY